jgi:hypothetical protein
MKHMEQKNVCMDHGAGLFTKTTDLHILPIAYYYANIKSQSMIPVRTQPLALQLYHALLKFPHE